MAQYVLNLAMVVRLIYRVDSRTIGVGKHWKRFLKDGVLERDKGFISGFCDADKFSGTAEKSDIVCVQRRQSVRVL